MLTIAHTPVCYTRAQALAVNPSNHKGANQVAREYTKMNNKQQNYRHTHNTPPHIKYTSNRRIFIKNTRMTQHKNAGLKSANQHRTIPKRIGSSRHSFFFPHFSFSVALSLPP